MYARVEISLYSSSSNLCVRGSLDELRHLPCLCAGGGEAGRLSPGPAVGAASPRPRPPHRVTQSLSLSLGTPQFWGNCRGEESRRSQSCECDTVTHDCVTDSLPGAADTNHNYKTQPESLLPTSDISGDNLSDHSPVTDLNTASGGR